MCERNLILETMEAIENCTYIRKKGSIMMLNFLNLPEKFMRIMVSFIHHACSMQVPTFLKISADRLWVEYIQ